MRLVHPTSREVAPEDLPDLYDEPGPHLRAGFVSSVDGVVAVDGRAGGLGSPADKAVFRTLRTVSDAVIVGAGTARTEDYGPVRFDEGAAVWRAANGRSAQAPLVVVTRSGRIPAGARFLEGPLIVAATDGVDVPGFTGEVMRAADGRALVAALNDRGFSRLLCEGGPSLLTSLLGEGLVDELCLTTSPQLVGAGPSLTGPIDQPTAATLTSLVLDEPGVLLARWSLR